LSDEPTITRDEKIAFLKHMFPERRYNYEMLAREFKKSKQTIEYWVATYEIPTVKFVGSPLIEQASLIEWLLRMDCKNCNEEKLQGLEFVIAELKKVHKKR
jgi:hypothetical protein